MSFPELNVNMKVPYARDINPYSKTNYIEGVIPDVPVSATGAFATANIEACKKLLETETDDSKKYVLEWTLRGFETDLNPILPDNDTLSMYTGTFENARLTLECGRLYFHYKDRAGKEIIPMGADLFKYADPGKAKYRIQFMRDGSGNVVEYYEHDSDGDTYPVSKRIE